MVAPLEAVALKVAVAFTDRVVAAGVTAPTTTVWGLTVKPVEAAVPAALVTVRVKALAAVMTPLLNGVPLVTVPTPLFTLPVPLAKTGVMVVLPP